MKPYNTINRSLLLAGMFLGLAFTACEDYTEHNFGSREDLYNATQVSTVRVTLANSDYENLIKNDSIDSLALAANDDSMTWRDLQSVAEKKYFRGKITPKSSRRS